MAERLGQRVCLIGMSWIFNYLADYLWVPSVAYANDHGLGVEFLAQAPSRRRAVVISTARHRSMAWWLVESIDLAF